MTPGVTGQIRSKLPLWMREPSIRARLFGSVGLLLTLLALVSTLSYLSFEAIALRANELVDREARYAFLADRANQQAQTAANLLLRLLLTRERDTRVTLYAAMDEALNANDKALEQLEQTSERYKRGDSVRELRKLRDRYGTFMQETVEQIELGGPYSAYSHFASKTEPALTAFLSAAAHLALVQQDLMNAEVDRLTQETRVAQQRIVLIGLLALATGALLAGLFATSVSKRVTTVASLADSIAGGDYAREIPSFGGDEIGSILRALGAMRDRVAEREAHIRRIAYVDEMTGLPNRADLFDRYRRSAADSGALLVVNLDRFSAINKALGHDVGDELLKGAAGRIGGILGTHDLLARMWGDEFVVLMHATDESVVTATAQRILDVLREPIQIGSQKLDLAASIGIAYFPKDAKDPVPLLRLADSAMRRAKRSFSGIALADLREDGPPPDHLSLIGEMRAALDRDEFELFYQPKLDLRNGEVTGAEALIRWRHPERGLIPPGFFMPFAEHTGFVREITPWVIRRVVRDTARWRRDGMELVISANLSTHDLLNPRLVETVIDALGTEGLPASRLCLEITESALILDPERAMLTLQQLADHGIKLSIDDYGSGQASLAYVRSLPVQELKIDRQFITEVDTTPRNAAIVKSTTLLCHELGLVVVAEGAERESEIDWLRQNACDIVQGYGIARPMSAHDFPKWVNQYMNRSPDESFRPEH